jgi:hypothetical protein
MECNYCGNKFNNQKSLKIHQRTAKYCLEKRGEVNKSFICKHCNKIFSQNVNLQKHLQKCSKKNSDIIDVYKEENTKLRIEIEVEKTKKEIYEKLYNKETQVIEKIALQPKITNNTNNTNNNNKINLAIYNLDAIKNQFAENIENIEASDLYDGQIAVARMVVPCLKNSEGKNMITCSDYSRSIFSYKDDSGNLNRDIKCMKLANAIEPIVSKKASSLMKEDYEKREKCRLFTEIKKRMREENILLEKMEEELESLSYQTTMYKDLEEKLNEKQDYVNELFEEYKRLEYEGATHIDEENFCDVKLVDGTEDIKKMKKNPTKFAKELSVHM